MDNTVNSVGRKAMPLQALLCAALLATTPPALAQTEQAPLSAAHAACTTWLANPIDHTWSAALPGWSPTATDAPLDGAVWAWLALDEHILSHNDLTTTDPHSYINARFAERSLMLSEDTATGLVPRFTHPSGWHIALDLDHEIQRISCLMWHNQDRWDNIPTQLGATIDTGSLDTDTMPDTVPPAATLRERGTKNWSRNDGYIWSTETLVIVLNPAVLPDAPRSYISLSVSLVTPEDGG